MQHPRTWFGLLEGHGALGWSHHCAHSCLLSERVLVLPVDKGVCLRDLVPPKSPRKKGGEKRCRKEGEGRKEKEKGGVKEWEKEIRV